LPTTWLIQEIRGLLGPFGASLLVGLQAWLCNPSFLDNGRVYRKKRGYDVCAAGSPLFQQVQRRLGVTDEWKRKRKWKKNNLRFVRKDKPVTTTAFLYQQLITNQ